MTIVVISSRLISCHLISSHRVAAALKAELSEDGLLEAEVTARLTEHGSGNRTSPGSVKVEGDLV
jgi:hypothetical protein